MSVDGPVVTVRYWAGARAAAGVDVEAVPAGSLAAVLAEVRRRHGAPLATVLDAASLLLDGVAVHRGSDPQVPPGALVEVLPPFAGG